jgi:hypothetical protein
MWRFGEKVKLFVSGKEMRDRRSVNEIFETLGGSEREFLLGYCQRGEFAGNAGVRGSATWV